MGSNDLVDVRIIALPLPVVQLAREHGEGLMREFALIKLADEEESRVPARLTDLVNELTERFSGFTVATDAELAEAEARGDGEMDLTYRVPAEAAEACVRLGELMDEADEYCRAGKHLLTLVTPPEALAFRRWFFDEFIRQIAGEAPLSWPDYVAAHPEEAGA